MTNPTIRSIDGHAVSRRGALAAIAAAPALLLPAAAQTRTVTAKRQTRQPTDPLSLAIAAARRGEAAARAMAGYSATLVKRERIGQTLLQSEMRIKLRHDPLAIYVQFVEPYEGRQILFREGLNDNNMLVRQTGLASLLGTMSVAPTSELALKENRHPITSAGMASLAAKTADQWTDAAASPQPPAVKRYPQAKFDQYVCEAFELNDATASDGVARSRLFLDRQTGLPIRAQRYERAGDGLVLVEDYAYIGLDLRTELTARDFDPANPEYGFE